MNMAKALVVTVAGVILLLTRPFVRWRFTWALIGAVWCLILTGCAALPMPLQPQTTQNTNEVELPWLSLDAADTVQTARFHHFRCREADPMARGMYASSTPPPGRVYLTNALLMAVHASVTSWLDDKVANEGDFTRWWWIRGAWHVASLTYSAESVVSNASQGCN